MSAAVLHHPPQILAARTALARHWPEYLMEASELGAFMVSACLFATLLEHPDSPIRQAIDDPLVRRIPMGLAMGLTATGIIHSRFGKRSGAHLNPAVTLTFFRLGKMAGWDALFYVAAQLLGGGAGVALAAAFLQPWIADPAVNYAATVPGPGGPGVAFIAELAISFVLMLVVLIVSNSERLARLTPLFAGSLVAIYIVLEAPLSGMSMNPARTVGSAAWAQVWDWTAIYFTAPPLGMLLAAETYLRLGGPTSILCAKLYHENRERCIFKCGYAPATPCRSFSGRRYTAEILLRTPCRIRSATGAGSSPSRVRACM